MAWQVVKMRTLMFAWKKLWHKVVSETDFERLESKAAVVEEIVSFNKLMGLDMKVTEVSSSRSTPRN